HHGVDVLGGAEACADRLGGAAQQGVRGVDVEVEVVGNVGGHRAAGEPADVGESIDQSGEVVDVLKGRGAVAAGLEVQRLHRGAAGAEVDALAADFEVVLRIATVEHERPARAGNDVLDHGRREAQASASVGPRAGRNCGIDQHRRRLVHAEFLENPERGGIDAA